MRLPRAPTSCLPSLTDTHTHRLTLKHTHKSLALKQCPTSLLSPRKTRSFHPRSIQRLSECIVADDSGILGLLLCRSLSCQYSKGQWRGWIFISVHISVCVFLNPGDDLWPDEYVKQVHATSTRCKVWRDKSEQVKCWNEHWIDKTMVAEE